MAKNEKTHTFLEKFRVNEWGELEIRTGIDSKLTNSLEEVLYLAHTSIGNGYTSMLYPMLQTIIESALQALISHIFFWGKCTC